MVVHGAHGDAGRREGGLLPIFEIQEGADRLRQRRHVAGWNDLPRGSHALALGSRLCGDHGQAHGQRFIHDDGIGFEGLGGEHGQIEAAAQGFLLALGEVSVKNGAAAFRQIEKSFPVPLVHNPSQNVDLHLSKERLGTGGLQ